MTQLREFRRLTLGLVVVTTLAILPGFLDVTNLPKLLVLIGGAALLMALLARGGILAGGSRATVLLPAAFVLAMVVSASMDGQHLYRVLYGVWGRNDALLAYASMAVVFVSLASAFRGRAASRVLFVLAGTGAVEALIGTAQHLAGTPGYWAKPYNPIMGTFGNPDFAAAFLGISAIALCGLALMRDLPQRVRVAGLLAGLLAVYLSVRTEAIQGPLAFGVGAAVAVTAWAFNLHAPRRLASIRWVLVGFLLAVAVGGMAAVAGRGPLASVLQSANLQDRFYLWRAALAMARQHPWFGVGIDSFAEQFRIVRGADLAAGGGIGTTADAAHSVPLNLLATGGLVAFIPYVAILLYVAVRGVRAARRSGQPLVAVVLIGAWAAYVASACFSLDQLGIAVWGWALGGAVIAASQPDADAMTEPPRRHRGPRVLVQLSLMALAFALLAWPLRASTRVLGALTMEPAGQRASTLSALADAAQDAPDPTLCQFVVYRLQDINAAPEAIAVARQCVIRFPNRLELWEPIADGLEQQGERGAATAARRRTVALDPRNAEFKRQLALELAAQ